MTDTFWLTCPSCDKRLGPYSASMAFGFHRCSCGTKIEIDTDAGAIADRYAVAPLSREPALEE